MDNLVKVQCILESGYNDKDLGEFINKNRIYYVTKERADLLEEKKVAKILEENIEKNTKTKTTEVIVDDINRNKPVVEKVKRRSRRTM